MAVELPTAGAGLRVSQGKRSLLALIVGAHSPLETKQALLGYLFLSPWLLGLVIFVSGPMIACFILSFAEYDILSPPKWIGFGNYVRAFLEDELFWPSLGRTFYYSILFVPLNIIGALILAILLNQGIYGTSLFRTMFFLPHLTPAVAMATLWVWLMNPEIGPLNFFLSQFGWPRNFPWL
ncbi:MAG: sugar ABC transporter permease, partial [Synergistales bacterium]|nr:sugar ABC transporter permease [Synergistales bacterium]